MLLRDCCCLHPVYVPDPDPEPEPEKPKPRVKTPEPEPEPEPIEPPELWDVEDSEPVQTLRQKVQAIVKKHCKEGKNYTMQHEFSMAFQECKTLGLNIGKPAFLSWMLLDIDGSGMVDNEKTVDWIIDNMMVNSPLLDGLPPYPYKCMPTEEELIEGTKIIKRKKIEDIEEEFMMNLFNQMDKKKERRVIRTEFENWFIIKMPKMNGHDRMKILGMLCKEFKSRDKKKKGYLEFHEFREMKAYILGWFNVFNMYSQMDSEGTGQIDVDALKQFRSILELPPKYDKEKNVKKLFAMIDTNDDKLISLYEWFIIFDIK